MNCVPWLNLSVFWYIIGEMYYFRKLKPALFVELNGAVLPPAGHYQCDRTVELRYFPFKCTPFRASSALNTIWLSSRFSTSILISERQLVIWKYLCIFWLGNECPEFILNLDFYNFFINSLIIPYNTLKCHFAFTILESDTNGLLVWMAGRGFLLRDRNNGTFCLFLIPFLLCQSLPVKGATYFCTEVPDPQ